MEPSLNLLFQKFEFKLNPGSPLNPLPFRTSTNKCVRKTLGDSSSSDQAVVVVGLVAVDVAVVVAVVGAAVVVEVVAAVSSRSGVAIELK